MTTQATTDNLCPMPLSVERMPLRWLCLRRGFDETTGFRVWGEDARKPVIRVSLRRAGIAGTRHGYIVEAYCDGHWDEIAFQPVGRGESEMDARDRAIALAEWEEAQAFNAIQIDPREASDQ